MTAIDRPAPMAARAGEAAGAAYGTVAKWFHWVTVALMAVALPVGFVIKHIKDADKMVFYAIHESAGLTLLIVAVLRLAWRSMNPPPPLPLSVPRPMRGMATGVHHAFYAMLILQPLMGFFMTNAYGFPMQGDTAYLGLIDLPRFMPTVEWLADGLKVAHMIGGWAILVLLVLHVLGVVFHQAVRRDGTLMRMV